jgi:two-component system, LuxR family, response regulator FixJ
MEREHEAIVAIIDDDDDVGDVLRGLLETVGYQVETYRSASEFLTNAKPENLACLVIDQNMPRMTGLGLLQQLALRGVTTPSLLITGAHDQEVARQALELGVMRVLEKPITTSELLRFISFTVD